MKTTLIALFLTFNFQTFASVDWWIIANGKNCLPVTEATHPETISKAYPYCDKITSGFVVEGIMGLDCSKSLLKTILVYSRDKKSCLEMLKHLKKVGIN